MERNVGNTDRVVRILAGLALLAAVFLLDSPQRWLGLIGIVPLATGLVRWCPAYTLLGLNTCGTARKAG
jgi:hypothetical protein